MFNRRHPEPPPKGMLGPRVNCLSRIIRIEFNEVLNSEGLFSGQHHIIMLLAHDDGLTVGQLAKRLGIAPATVSVSLKRMEKAGFIIKKADKKDARTTKIYLTDKSNDMLGRIKEKMAQQEKLLCNGLSEDEVNQLSDLLDKVIRNFIAKEDNDD